MSFPFSLGDFLTESNRIEGIHEIATFEQTKKAEDFLKLEKITVSDLVNIVSVFQPNARIRDRYGLDVYVGNHHPPKGGPEITTKLEQILDGFCYAKQRRMAYLAHHEYETLHPFTDGNGRSGRLLWLWMMNGNAPLGFLHTWYYQSLEFSR